jgi:peptidoglycan/LPS O-acetylase OafA/YrhL
MSERTHRVEIDGLRAIAILGVVLFHYGVSPLGGGFAGVDVFFVISGYLITSIIAREVSVGEFSFERFYERRVRRLLPALAVMLTVTTIAALWLFLPSDLLALSKTMLATLLFSSNLFFWRTAGYFDSASELDPLLHTWSLAVEEQFYIGLPFILLLVHAFFPKRQRLILWGITLASLIACVALQRNHSSMVFYLSPFRAWELGAGSLLAVGPREYRIANWLREGLTSFALIVLVLSLVLVKAGPTFPGWQALFPVLSTAVLIGLTSGADCSTKRVLQSRPLAYIGRISYSLYLWYLPILSFYRYLIVVDPSAAQKCMLIVGTVLVASLSFHFVEQPFRTRSSERHTNQLFRLSVVTIACFIVGSASSILTRGFPWRFDAQVRAADAERYPSIPFLRCIDNRVYEQGGPPRCLAGALAVPPTFLIWGDSHALAWMPALEGSLAAGGRSAELALESACPPLLGVANPSNVHCEAVNDAIFSHISKSPQISTVVLTAAWVSYSATSPYQLRYAKAVAGNEHVFPPALRATVAALRRLGKKVWIIGPTPGGPAGILLWRARSLRSPINPPPTVREDEFTRRAAIFRGIADSLVVEGQIAFSDPSPQFCRRNAVCDYLRNEQPLYRDAGHLSVQGARMLTPFTSAELRRVEGMR